MKKRYAVKLNRKENDQLDGDKISSSICMTIAGFLLLCLFPLLCTSYTSITEFKKNSFLILTILVLVLWVMAVIVEKKKPEINWRILLGLLYCGSVAVSAVFGSYRDVLNTDGKLAVFWGLFRGDSLQITIGYTVLYCCFSSINIRMEDLVPFCGEAVLFHFLVVTFQFAGINILNLFPEGLSVRTNYIFQGTLGNVDFTPGYIMLMVPILFMPYLWEMGRLRIFSLICGMAGICTVLVSRVVTGKLLIAALMVGIAILILRYPGIAERGFLLASCLFFLLTANTFMGLPWYTGEETFVFSLFSPIRTILYLSCGIACLIVTRLLNKKVISIIPLSRKIIVLSILIALGVCLIVIFMVPFTPRNGTLWEIHEILNGRERNSFGHYRWGVWKHVLELSRNNWLFGTGPDTFYYSFRDHIKQIGDNSGTYDGFDFAHNAYLNILVCNGLFTMLIYVFLNAMLCIHAFRSRRSIGTMCGLSLACYCIFEFFSFSIFFVAPMAWTIRGILAGMKVREECGENNVSLRHSTAAREEKTYGD